MKIIPYNETFHDALYDLQVAQWGDGSDTDDIFNNIDNYQIRLLVEEDRLFGACVWHMEDPLTCYIDFILLVPEIQHQGWGRKMLNEALSWAQTFLIPRVKCSAIDVCGTINSQRLLESSGFVRTETIPNYWGNLYPDFHCTECGQTPCICTMHSYLKTLRK